MAIDRISTLMAAVMLLQAIDQPQSGTRVEVDESADRFRVVVEESMPVTIYPWQLEAPSEGLPPRNAYVLIRAESGEVIGCGKDNAPHRAAAVSSRSIAAADMKPLTIEAGEAYDTGWHNVRGLFVFFDECVLPERRGGYAEYKVLVRVDSLKGYLTAETPWLAFPGFNTSAWNSVLHPTRQP